MAPLRGEFKLRGELGSYLERTYNRVAADIVTSGEHGEPAGDTGPKRHSLVM